MSLKGEHFVPGSPVAGFLYLTHVNSILDDSRVHFMYLFTRILNIAFVSVENHFYNILLKREVL